MSALDGVEVGLGAVIVLVTLYDVFQPVVLPRPAVGRVRLTTTFIDVGWRGWRRVAERPSKLQMREAALAAFAPMMIVALLVIWAFCLVLGYALIFSGLREGLSPQPDMFKVGVHLVADMRLYFRYRDSDEWPGVEREEWQEACERLRTAGYRLRDTETAWEAFRKLRSEYAAWLNETTRYMGVPPAPWIGDRSYLPHRERGRSGRARRRRVAAG